MKSIHILTFFFLNIFKMILRIKKRMKKEKKIHTWHFYEYFKTTKIRKRWSKSKHKKKGWRKKTICIISINNLTHFLEYFKSRMNHKLNKQWMKTLSIQQVMSKMSSALSLMDISWICILICTGSCSSILGQLL